MGTIPDEIRRHRLPGTGIKRVGGRFHIRRVKCVCWNGGFVAADDVGVCFERKFVFSREADAFNQQEILLRLEEPVAGKAQFALYQEFAFNMRRASESDFDES